MKRTLKSYIPVLLLALSFFSGCRIEPIDDPNNPGLGPISASATLGEIQNLVDGTEAAMRNNLSTYYDDVSVIGREYYRFSTSDPRFTSDLLGKEGAVLDNNTFYITNPYSARYRVVRNLYILMDAVQNTKAAISDAQKRATVAYAKTLQAYQLLLVYNLLYNNGIRVDVENPDQLGPFLSRQQSIDEISKLLNDAYTDLRNNTAAFPFTTSMALSTPASLNVGTSVAEFAKINRAIAARVAVYRQDWASANTALAESFLDLNGNLNTGVYHRFSTAGGDELNPLFIPANSPAAENRLAHPSFVTDASPNDNRVSSKVSLRTTAGFQDGLQSNYDFLLYKSNTDPIPIIRNEELILLYAEVKAQTNMFSDAVTAINRIRTAAGIGNYGGAQTQAALITEILRQRRYSLFGEGHRWIDLRRYGRLAELQKDRANDDVWEQFPRPANE
jgi:hypothetical protein